MKATLFFLLLPTLLAAPGGAVGVPENTSTVTQTQATGAVPAAFPQLTFLQGEPDKDARFYIYIQSASWCGPCRKYMPIIVEHYAKMKRAGVEMILVGRDSTAESTLAYAQGHGVPFPVLQGAGGLSGRLPGFAFASAIPHIRIVDRNGAVLLDGHPQHFFTDGDWREQLVTWASAPAGAINPDMDDENGRYDIVVRNGEDMEAMLRTMASHLRPEQKFQSRIPLPAPLVWETVAAHDILGGFSISGGSGDFTLVPAYLDSWRMLHAYQRHATAGGQSAPLGGWGVELTAEEFQALTELRKRIAKLASPQMSDAAKLLAIHDDLVNRATFKNGGEPSAAGLILHNEGGCDAYARYMYLALNLAGIDCHRVVGTDGFNHSWNMVRIDKKWYHLDAAWDDPACTKNGKPQAILSHEFCCVSDATLSKTHKWNRSIYPEAKEDFPFSFRRAVSTPSALQTAMRLAYRTGAATLEVRLGFKELSYLTTSTTPVDFYAVTDKENGYAIIYFDRTESGAAPIELEVSPRPVETTDQASRWLHVTSGD